MERYCSCINVLGEIKDIEAFTPLLVFLKSNDPTERQLTCFALGSIGDRRGNRTTCLAMEGPSR